MPADISKLRIVDVIDKKSGKVGKAGALGVTFSGFAPVMSALGKRGEVVTRVQEAAKRVMIEATENVLSEAMAQVPHDKGMLEGSGYAVVFVDGKRVSGSYAKTTEGGSTVVTRSHKGLGDAVVGEVGFNMPYALEQHERTDFKHKEGRKAKYLEDPVKAKSGTILEELRSEVAGALA